MSYFKSDNQIYSHNSYFVVNAENNLTFCRNWKVCSNVVECINNIYNGILFFARNHLSQTYYGMSRSESAAPACTYGAQSMRTPAQSSAALYQQYGYQDGYCPSGEDGVHDESTFIRKRKHDDVYPTDLAPKRVTSVGDYTYDMTSCYPRS